MFYLQLRLLFYSFIPLVCCSLESTVPLKLGNIQNMQYIQLSSMKPPPPL